MKNFIKRLLSPTTKRIDKQETNMAVIIDDDDEREDKDDTEESMDHPTTGNPRNRRQLEELVYHLEETKIEMQKKGENFVPMRSSNNNANEIGLDALAPSLAKPVSASREMFERGERDARFERENEDYDRVFQQQKRRVRGTRGRENQSERAHF